MPSKLLFVVDLQAGESSSFDHVTGYLWSNKGRFLCIKSGGASREKVTLLNISNGKQHLVWEGAKISSIMFDNADNKLALLSQADTAVSAGKALVYYDIQLCVAKRVTDGGSPFPGLYISALRSFSRDGRRIFLRLVEPLQGMVKRSAIKLDVWGYRDVRLQSLQQHDPVVPKSYLSVVNLSSGHMLRLQYEGDKANPGDHPGQYVLVSTITGNPSLDDKYWSNVFQTARYSYLSAITGERKQLESEYRHISPDDRFFIGGGDWDGDLYAYEIAKGVSLNLTGKLSVPQADIDEQVSSDKPAFKQHNRGFSLAGFLSNGDLLVYGGFDIWQLSPDGSKVPVCITGGDGHKRRIRYRLAEFYDRGKLLPVDSVLIITAFNVDNKYAGFGRILPGRASSLVLLHMSSHSYNGRLTLKAKDAAVYIVGRESAQESVNLFLSKDLVSYTAVTDIHPEQGFNWLSSELLMFTTLHGKKERAILYKPENFNASKRYPVLVTYYERRSDELNHYPSPFGEGGGSLDIAWFVSHGYLVLVPDICYRIGETGESAVDAVVGAAEEVSRLPWVDKSRIGLHGFSFGGYETNYIIAHSNLFAAACSNSGIADVVSYYVGLWGESGESKMMSVEMLQFRFGGSLWERPDVYIRNSPIFRADQVMTPVLIIANKKDGLAPFAQGMGWFLALRRLGKRSWMLQYDNGGHGLVGREDYVDYVIRLTQFFDHYLKDSAAPNWMTKGIPFAMKGVDDGLELDHETAIPEEGLFSK